MQQLKFILVTSLIISCMADDMKKHQSNETKTDQKAKDMKPVTEESKTIKDAKSMLSNEAKSTSTDHAKMDLKMMDPKVTKDAPGETKPMSGAAHKDPNGPNDHPEADQIQKSKEDMKVEATMGLGFYAGVAPLNYGGYGGYGYGYPSYPYYRSYYARPYYGYSYRPIVPVIVRPRPVPLLLG